jgi:hypothetical protein
MPTADFRSRPQSIPNWGFETLRVMADTHRLVDDIERRLRYAVHLEGLEPRVSDKLQLVRDALGVVQVSLSALEVTAQQVLAEIAEVPRPADRLAPGA